MSDWISDVCSSDLLIVDPVDRQGVLDQIVGADREKSRMTRQHRRHQRSRRHFDDGADRHIGCELVALTDQFVAGGIDRRAGLAELRKIGNHRQQDLHATELRCAQQRPQLDTEQFRSEAHTSELQSLMRISYAVFCLKKKTKNKLTSKIYKPTTTTQS